MASDEEDCLPVYKPSPYDGDTPQTASPISPSRDRPASATALSSGSPPQDNFREIDGVRYAHSLIPPPTVDRPCFSYMSRIASDFKRILPHRSMFAKRPFSLCPTPAGDLDEMNGIASTHRSHLSTAIAFIVGLIAAANDKRCVPSIFDIPRKKHASMSFQSYVYRWVSHIDCPMDIFVAAVVYMDRASEAISITPINVHRIWASAVVLAQKMYTDLIWTNAFYSNVAGIPLIELNALEVNLFTLLDCKLVITREEFLRYVQALNTIASADYSFGIRRACSIMAREIPVKNPAPATVVSHTPSPGPHVSSARIPRSSSMLYPSHSPAQEIVHSASTRVPTDQPTFHKKESEKNIAINSDDGPKKRHRLFRPLQKLFGKK